MSDIRFKVRMVNDEKRERIGVLKKIFLITLLLAISASIYFFNGYLMNFADSIFSYFKIKTVEVVDAKSVDIKRINNFLSGYKGKYITSVSFNDIYNELMKDEWVCDVIIQKKYPSKLLVQIIEEKPVALLNHKGDFFLISENGKLIKNYAKEYLNREFIIFSSKTINEYHQNKDIFLNIYKELQTRDIKNISEVFVGGELEVYTYKPYRKYILDSKDIAGSLDKVKLFEKMYSKLFPNGEDIKVINLKYSNKIFVKI